MADETEKTGTEITVVKASDVPKDLLPQDLMRVDNVFLVATQQERIKVASDIATQLAKIIKDKGLSTVFEGKDYVWCTGWTTMGALLPCMVTPRTVETKEIGEGRFWGKVELVCNGKVIGGAESEASVDEGKGVLNRRGEPSKGKFKTPAAARSMAQTRATSKAFRLAFAWIMVLAGYQELPAEELNGMLTMGEDVDTEKVEKARDAFRKANAENKLNLILLNFAITAGQFKDLDSKVIDQILKGDYSFIDTAKKPEETKATEPVTTESPKPFLEFEGGYKVQKVGAGFDIYKDGKATYLVTKDGMGCTCPAGMHSKPCKHRTMVKDYCKAVGI